MTQIIQQPEPTV